MAMNRYQILLAKCRGRTELFYPQQGERVEAAQIREAKALALCRVCPVREPCLADCDDDPYGVWGGTTPEDRGWTRGQTRTRVFQRNRKIARSHTDAI